MRSPTQDNDHTIDSSRSEVQPARLIISKKRSHVNKHSSCEHNNMK